MMALILGTFSTVLVALALIWLWRLKPGPYKPNVKMTDQERLLRQFQAKERAKRQSGSDYFA